MVLFSWIVGRKRDFVIEFVDPAIATPIKVHCARFLRAAHRNPRRSRLSAPFRYKPEGRDRHSRRRARGHQKNRQSSHCYNRLLISAPRDISVRPGSFTRPQHVGAGFLSALARSRGAELSGHQATASYACSIQLKRPRPLWSDARQGAGARMGRDAQGHPTHKAAHQTPRRRLA
jgi:hypothetical protein